MAKRMKSGSSSPRPEREGRRGRKPHEEGGRGGLPHEPWLTQRMWRVAGGISLALAAVMAWYGAGQFQRGLGVLYLLGYWGVFTLLLLVSLYAALLDIRYTRLKYALAQRKIFYETLGSESFRAELRKAQEERKK